MRVVGERHERVHPGPRRERDDREARGEGEALGVGKQLATLLDEPFFCALTGIDCESATTVRIRKI